MIRITRQSDYGIVLLSAFVVGETGELRNARDLSVQTQVPLPMVSKILKALARAGLLRSHRGVKGGYALARPAGRITVAQIIEAIEGPIAITECLDDEAEECGIERSCPVRSNWNRINGAIRTALSGIALSEMTHALTHGFALKARPGRREPAKVG
ncbi:MAG: SUF system Fe-S cluster assembly regulator [Planctomycetaceae bacterium]